MLCYATLCYAVRCYAMLRWVVFHPSSGPCSDRRLWDVDGPLSFADSSGSFVLACCAMPCLGLASAVVLLTAPCCDRRCWDVDGPVSLL